MHNVLRFYRHNVKQIWVTIIFGILLFALLQWLNQMARDEKNRNNILSNQNSSSISNSSTTTVPEKEKNVVVSGIGLSDEEAKKNKNIINTFVGYCNDKDIEKAYDLLTVECKEKMFPTIQDFYNNYCAKVFKEAKVCDMQTWVSTSSWYTYKVALMGDILASGKVEQSNVFTDYYTIVRTKEGEMKLNINSYVGREKLEKGEAGGNLTIKIISKDVYMDYEVYNLELKNNTDKIIMIDSKRKTDTVFVSDENNLKYQAYMYEIDDSLLKIEGNMERKISIKFNKIYNPNRKLTFMSFTDIILDYERYRENPAEYTRIENRMIDL